MIENNQKEIYDIVEPAYELVLGKTDRRVQDLIFADPLSVMTRVLDKAVVYGIKSPTYIALKGDLERVRYLLGGD